MNTVSKTLVLCLAAVLSMGACKKSDTGAVGNAVEKVTAMASGSNLLTDAAALQAAEDALKAMPQYKGKAVNVFQNVKFYGGSGSRIEIDVQDPANPENIDHFEYKNGKWSEPSPVQISGGGDMKSNVTPLDKIKFATVASISQAWAAKAKEVGAEKQELDFAVFQLFVPNQDRYWTTASIETPRAKYDMRFNPDGSLKSFEKQ
ncbi:hypothetical protein [Neisseria sp.]|uniref:hypothetical protein n=1 Tax=Neisseria sp. TaxID=192066 RepID=UPI00359F7F37